jgi:hypothetical protein
VISQFLNGNYLEDIYAEDALICQNEKRLNFVSLLFVHNRTIFP